MAVLATLKSWAKSLRDQALTVHFAARDPRTPLWIKGLAVLVVAYAFSPIDLIPDFIPVLGLLDDFLILPLGLSLVIRWLPKEVFLDARKKALDMEHHPVSYLAIPLIVLAWLAAAAAGWWLWRLRFMTGP